MRETQLILDTTKLESSVTQNWNFDLTFGISRLTINHGQGQLVRLQF